MDLAIILVLLVVVIFVFKSFSSAIYFLASLDILLRILAFIKTNVPVPELKALIGRYFPSSLESIIAKYTSGIFYHIFIWLYAIVFMIFLFYTLRIFFKKR
jgi:hypothetical protein